MNKVYDDKTEYLIEQEFQRLKGQCYLDHAGATLYSESQIKNICNDLCTNVYGNPHSLSLHSKNCTDIVDEVRNRILKHFHTNQSEYSLIFTSGATASIRLLLDNFDWNAENDEDAEEYYDSQTTIPGNILPCSVYVYTQSNHTSIIGGRESAAERGVPFMCLGYEESFSILSQEPKYARWKLRGGNSLFAYPAQCNYSGRKYPLEWIDKVHRGALDCYGTARGENRNSKWFVLLDAATYCSTSDLDLSKVKPDFVCLSFYKIFGYPTGLGALLVRNSSAHVLSKTYFGGGSVEISLASQNFHKFRRILHERFEDGTISFLSIIALDHGLKTLRRLNLTMKTISEHVFNLANYAYRRMKALQHWNGQELVEFYADSDYSDTAEQGGIINFNLMRSDRRYIGFTEVLHIANLNNIQFRTGCFCNSGACQRHLRLTDRDLKKHFEAGHVCGDAKDLINGKPTGSIRISFGYMTTSENIDTFIKMIKDSFLETVPSVIRSQKQVNGCDTGQSTISLRKIWLYPIKSCGAMEADSWKLNEKGLNYDREWMIVTSTGICLTQKQQPRMGLIVPKLDLMNRTMMLSFRTDGETVTIPIDVNDEDSLEYNTCESKICGDRILGYDCGDEVADWLSRHLEVDDLRLVKQSKEDERKNKIANDAGEHVKLSLSNQAQYLLINNRSVEWLQERIEPGDDINMETFVNRFRGNFLIDGADEFAETKWSHLSIGSIDFKVEGPCGRCQMICIDQHTGEKSRKPLVALSRALNGKTRFGIYLSHIKNSSNMTITVGDQLKINEYSEV